MYRHPKRIGSLAQRKQIDKMVTVPKMTEPLAKTIQAALKNPVDQMLDMYSSKHPDLLDPIDLKMMSKLDRLRKHNELRQITLQQKKQLDDTLLKGLNEKAKKDKVKQEMQRQEDIKKEAEKLSKQKPN